MKWFSIIVIVALASSLAFAGAYPAVAASYEAFSADTYRLASSEGDVACAPTASGDWLYEGAKLIEIRAGEAIFGGPDDVMTGDDYFDKVYFDPIGLTVNGQVLNGQYYQDPNVNNWKPRVFWKVPGRDCYNWNHFSINTRIGVPVLGTPLQGASSGITYANQASFPSLPLGNYLVVNEYIGGHEGMASTWVPYIAENPSYSTHRFKLESPISQVYYWSAINAAHTSYEPTLVTERGSKWTSISTTDVSMLLAKQVAEPSFTFSQEGLSGTHVFSTLITDTLDRTTKNRQNTLVEDEWRAEMSSPDTNGLITSPLRAVEGNTAKAKNLYRIGETEFLGFADYTMEDPQASVTYTEKQSFWAGSSPNGVAYDSDVGIRDVAVNKYTGIAYSSKVDGNDYGIPVCTGDLSPGDDWASCPENSNSRTENHRVKIMHFGSEWIISKMQNPETALASSVSVVNGGLVNLAKESAYDILNEGGQGLAGGYYTLKLAGVLPDNIAVIDLYNPDNQLVGQIQVSAGTTYTFTYGQESIKMHVYSTNAVTIYDVPGWAEVGVYSEEIGLSDGSRYNHVPSTHKDKNFRISLLWKNRDYTGAESSTTPDCLREIVVYHDYLDGKTKKGEEKHMLESSPTFTLRFDGIEPDVSPMSPELPVYANNTTNSNTLTVLPSPANAGTTFDSAYNLPYGAVVPIGVSSNPGYSFAGWKSSTGNCPTILSPAFGWAAVITPDYGNQCLIWGKFNRVGTKQSSNNTTQIGPASGREPCPILGYTHYDCEVAGGEWTDSNNCYHKCVKKPTPSSIGVAKDKEKEGSKTSTGSASEAAPSTGAAPSGEKGGETTSTGSASASSGSSESSVDVSDVAGAMVDVETDTYAKLMNILGIYVEQYQE